MIFHKQLEVGYTNFKISESIYLFKQLNCWCRRKIRCYRLKQRKRNYYIKTFLRKLGVTRQQSWKLASSGKGWWRMSLNNVMYRGMNLNWFKRNSYFSFNEAFGKHKFETALCNIARTVVWQRASIKRLSTWLKGLLTDSVKVWNVIWVVWSVYIQVVMLNIDRWSQYWKITSLW